MRAALILASAVALAGCGGGDPIVLIDGGVRTDTGTSPTDGGGGGGTDTGGGGGTDAGTCPPVMSPAPAGDSCAAATLTCLVDAAGNPTAQQACIMADPMAMACQACLQQEAFSSCTSMGSCADEFGLLQCCLTDACPTGDAACINMASAAGGACASQGMAAINCVNTDATAGRCGNSQTLCFMAP